MIRNMIPLFLCYSLVFAEDPESANNQLSSTHASYNGNALVLQGKVQLDHGLGNMTADEAFLQKQETGKDFPFSLIQLKKDVLVSLKNKSELRCSSAELDFNELTGVLSSIDEEKVSYQELQKKEGSSSDFRVLSKLIDLKLIKQEALDKSQYGIESLVAKNEVQIEYAHEFTLEADEASYQNLEPQNSNKKSGILKAYPLSSGAKCKISFQKENIEADLIHIDIEKTQIQVQNPNGSIPSGLFVQSEASPLLFKCQDLLWNHKNEVLLLKNEVSIQESTLGSLHAEKEMTIKQKKSQNKNTIESLHIDGPSRLEYQDSSSGWKHTVSSCGSLHVDGAKGQIVITSPKGSEKLIRYEDQELILLASKAFIEYSEFERKPLSIALQESVSIQSTSGPLRLGIADRLTYSPDTQTVILSALPKKRVLFQDEEQNLSMSAQEVHLTKDPLTGKTQVKGIGNVKFSLTSEEDNVLKNRFLFKSKGEKNGE